jgi:ATP-binding cassette subfamily B protein
MDNVTFGYNDDDVLHDFSLSLKPGHLLGLLGRTGSEKTTITRLLLRLYDPREGSIQLSGSDVRAITLEELRGRVGMVNQNVQLFRGTLRQNLTLFDPSISDDAIIPAHQELGLYDRVNGLEDGLDTELKSDGAGLSAGEAQLLSLARIFLRDPGLVILDEASSRLDPVTEARLERASGKLLENRTGIIIAHRLDTVNRTDDILILDDGR